MPEDPVAPLSQLAQFRMGKDMEFMTQLRFIHASFLLHVTDGNIPEEVANFVAGQCAAIAALAERAKPAKSEERPPQ